MPFRRRKLAACSKNRGQTELSTVRDCILLIAGWRLGTVSSVPAFCRRLAAFEQDALPDAVDSLLQLGRGFGSNLVQVGLGGAAHDQQILFRHTSHDWLA